MDKNISSTAESNYIEQTRHIMSQLYGQHNCFVFVRFWVQIMTTDWPFQWRSLASPSRANAAVVFQFQPQALNVTSFQSHCPLTVQSLALCNLRYFHCCGNSSSLQKERETVWHIQIQKLPTALTATLVQCTA